MHNAPRAHTTHAQRHARSNEQTQQTRHTQPHAEVTYAALQQQEEDDEKAETAAAAAIARRSPSLAPSAVAHAAARASDDVHTALSSLKTENTLLGSIIQQLQLDRQNKANLLRETAKAKEALEARCGQLEAQLGNEGELKDALVAQSSELSSATQALRLLKLSSHRQIAEVCASWKAEVEQVRQEKEQEIRNLRNRHGAYMHAGWGRSGGRVAPRPDSQTQQQRAPSQQQQQRAGAFSSQNDAPTRPFSQQSGFSHRSHPDASSVRDGQTTAPSKATIQGEQQQQQQQQQQQEEDGAEDFAHEWDGAHPLHIEERCSMLELALEREQASNISLRSAALATSHQTAQLHDRLAALTTQSRAQLESIQDLQAKLYAQQGLLEGYEVQRRMQQSRKVLDQLHVDQPVSAGAPAAVSGAPTKAAVAASAGNAAGLASSASSFNASAAASASSTGVAASDAQTAAALRLLQSELSEERRLASELRALYSLSQDTERSLRSQLIHSTDFSLGLQQSLKELQVAHREQAEEAVEISARMLRIERDYHRALREVRYANQLLRAASEGGQLHETQELDTPPSSLLQPRVPGPPANAANSDSNHALHFAAAATDEDEITQITNAARRHAPPPPQTSSHEMSAERDRPAQHQQLRQQPARFR